ncbi:MAG: hypothetical protein CL910_21890 [Deltaproteobacteria bacterium]|nr:hypothetical protein [Deltaproteobacteria bacterium]
MRHRPRVLPLLGFVSAILLTGLLADRWQELGRDDVVGTLLAIALFALAGFLTSRSTRFVFDAATGQVRWQHVGLLRSSEGALPFSAIQQVRVEPEPLNPDGGSFRVVLGTSDGPLPLTPHYSGTEPHEENARAIRTWLSDHGVEPT